MVVGPSAGQVLTIGTPRSFNQQLSWNGTVQLAGGDTFNVLQYILAPDAGLNGTGIISGNMNCTTRCTVGGSGMLIASPLLSITATAGTRVSGAITIDGEVSIGFGVEIGDSMRMAGPGVLTLASGSVVHGPNLNLSPATIGMPLAHIIVLHRTTILTRVM